MPEPRTAKQIAEHIIRDAIADIEWMTIGEMTEDEAKALDEEAYDDLRHEVDDLLSTATATITFPQADGEVAPEVPAELVETAANALLDMPSTLFPDGKHRKHIYEMGCPVCKRDVHAMARAVLTAVMPAAHARGDQP